jgi:aldehyde dehydrogenase (NAD+)
MLDTQQKTKTYQTYIDGKWVDAASGKAFETLDPYTGESWALIPECDDTDVNRAVEAAYRAFETGSWPNMTPTMRGKKLRLIGDLIAKHSEHLAGIEVRDNGKLISEMVAQTRYMPEWFYYYGGLADKIQGAVVSVDRPEHFNYILREPVGCARLSRHGTPRLCSLAGS